MSRQYAQILFSHLLVDIEKLYTKISSLFHQTQVSTLQIHRIKALHLYWNMGRLIIEAECDENISDEDHHKLLYRLSERLTKKFGEQLDFSALEDSYKFYLIYSLFPKINTLSGVVEIPEFQAPLTWAHYHLLIHVSCSKARIFMKKKPATATGLHPYLSTLLNVACLKDSLPAQIKKVCCGLLNKEVWSCFQQIQAI